MDNRLEQQWLSELRTGIREIWDADEDMPATVMENTPPGRFVSAVHVYDAGVLRWLTFFVARRALPCWELSCESKRPREIVTALGEHLVRGHAVDWDSAVQRIPSPFQDCRYSDTQSAADAVVEAACYISRLDPRHALFCISAADVAYQHVLGEDCFREWLLDVAIPVAFQKREMTAIEQEALRGSRARQ